MRSLARFLAASMWIALPGCRQADEPANAPRADGPAPDVIQQQSAPAPPASERDAFDWSRHAGRCVVAEGYASGAKIGPRLEGGGWAIGVALAEPGGDVAWWRLSGARVRVQGVVTQRADLPVFIQKEGEPIMQGMPVPEGTDLDKARRRYVLERASVTRLRTLPEVEANLSSQLGQDVRLEGVVWSLNGHYWFNHDSVDLHVAGHEAVAGFRDMHGRPVTLRGRLERRMLPRLDQIVLKPNRDLAEAFLLHVREMSPHPVSGIVDCPAPSPTSSP
jgi:hypothetical protein